MIRNLSAALTCFALLATASATWGVEVTLPSSLDALVDDPNDPNDDASAFILSPSGRFRFSDFLFSPLGTDTVPPDVGDVQVSIAESDSMVNLTFQLQAGGTAMGPGAYELALQYAAESIDPQFAFRGHTLSMDGTTEGDGSILINEEILADGAGIGNVTTTANVTNVPDTFSDTLDFAPTRSMTVQNKDISVVGGTGGATLVSFEQSFSVIPEPGSLALLAVGLVGFGLTTRRLHRTTGVA